jgi:hypothetical protein
MGATDPSRPERRELAHRVNSGLEVTLWLTRSPMPWGSRVRDWRSATHFEVPVTGDHALDAFHHPYSHVAARGMDCARAGAL